MKVLVIGGSGFIGRSVVASLVARGHQVTVGTRNPASLRQARSVEEPPQLKMKLHTLTDARHWAPLVDGFDVVVNAAGILRERWGESFDAVYRRAPAAIATSCAAKGKRFIHVTALGLTAEARSGFISAKLAGERAIARIGGESCIVRPSLLDGEGGFGARWIRRVAQWPVHFVPADAIWRLAPLQVRELGEAIAALCECAASELPANVDLGGETRFTLAAYLSALRTATKPALVVPVPACLVRLCAHLFDLLRVTPLSWGHVELMRRDNLPCADDLLALRRWLGRDPERVGVRRYLTVSTPALATTAS